MKNNKLHHTTMAALAMTTCGLTLWLAQNDGWADDKVTVDNTSLSTTNINSIPANDTKGNNTYSQATTDESQQQVIDTNDNGNYANLDSAKLNDKGQLTVSGWHATNQVENKDYHYIIAYDQTNQKEIARKNVTNDAVNRPDVAKAHNVYGATNSGFKTSFDLSKSLANTQAVQIISRYTSDPQGNGSNPTDYWFAPITIDKNNYAHLDSAEVADGELTLTGWNATNLAADKPYHYVIVLDRTTGKEVTRKLVKNETRNDVAKVYPSVENSANSGFNASLDANLFNFNHQLQVLSRYSSVKDGNSNYVDYYFNPITSENYANEGHLDGFKINNSQLTVSGWHANDVSKFEDNHFIILYDNTANKQIAVVNVDNLNRVDVAKAYPSIMTAEKSGFSTAFDLSKINLVGGHSYSIVSRYSTNNKGNGGGSGSYTDFWFTPVVLNQHASSIDSVKMTEQGLSLSGWMASDYSVNYQYAYIIVLNNGKEVTRQKVELTSRPDVAKAYPKIANSGVSGFNTTISLNPNQINGTMQLILRFTNNAYGNGNYDDQYSMEYPSNQGHFDTVTVTDTGIYISGWHASNQSADKKYQWLIFLDQNGHELYRQEVLDINRARTDVEKVYPYILKSGRSGYQLGFNLPSQMQHKVVKIIHRFTNDQNGNGSYVDFYSGDVSINSGAQTSGNKTTYYDALGNIIGVFNNAEVICQLPELPTGCEITAVTMMLRYAGYNVNKIQLANEMPRSNNGDYGFVGDPFSYSGWWIFPTGIAPVVNHYVGHSDILTGTTLQNIQQHLLNGHLVVVWMANMNGFINHAITLTGYNSNGFTYNNPWTGRKEAMSYGEFYSHWNADRQRAISY